MSLLTNEVFPTWYSDEGQKKRHEVRKNAKEVNDVHEAFDELAMIGTGEEPHNELDGEPGHVDCLQDINHRIMVYNGN